MNTPSGIIGAVGIEKGTLQGVGTSRKYVNEETEETG